jgi:hypothetical protein
MRCVGVGPFAELGRQRHGYRSRRVGTDAGASGRKRRVKEAEAGTAGGAVGARWRGHDGRVGS